VATIATAGVTARARSGGSDEALQPRVHHIDAQTEHRAQALKERGAGGSGRRWIRRHHRLAREGKRWSARSKWTAGWGPQRNSGMAENAGSPGSAPAEFLQCGLGLRRSIRAGGRVRLIGSHTSSSCFLSWISS